MMDRQKSLLYATAILLALQTSQGKAGEKKEAKVSFSDNLFAAATMIDPWNQKEKPYCDFREKLQSERKKTDFEYASLNALLKKVLNVLESNKNVFLFNVPYPDFIQYNLCHNIMALLQCGADAKKAAKWKDLAHIIHWHLVTGKQNLQNFSFNDFENYIAIQNVRDNSTPSRIQNLKNHLKYRPRNEQLDIVEKYKFFAKNTKDREMVKAITSVQKEWFKKDYKHIN